MKQKITEFDREFLQKEFDNGSLFVLEKHLGHIPWDWHDCVMFIATQGLDKNPQAHLICLEENSTERLFKVMAQDKIKLYVFSEKKTDDKNVIWNCLITKENVEGHPDPKALYVGGEKLREFCDDRNIFYRSVVSEDGYLLSGSNLQWLKKEGEDCRDPKNPIFQE